MVSLGLWAHGQARWWGGPSLLSIFQCTGSKLLANVYPLPQLMYNTVLASVNKQSCAAAASDSLAFSAHLLLLLFLINMPELFRHLLLCYLWFVNIMFTGKNHNHSCARAVHTARKNCCKARGWHLGPKPNPAWLVNMQGQRFRKHTQFLHEKTVSRKH